VIVESHKKVEVKRSYSVARALALFNVPPEDVTEFHIHADIPVEDNSWRIGAIVGPSGSGKTTLVEALKDVGYVETELAEWSHELSILDGVAGGFDAATGALASVGLGTVPSWVRPYHILSNGEKFRANLARTLNGTANSVVIDEFTSVVDRRVACIGAGAFAKAWRRRPSGQVIVVGPHFDILPWMKPDWIVRTSTTGPTVTAEDWEAMKPEVERDPEAPTILEVTV
jgi:ABC-type ATPase with predicted acetyltransferase domain